MFCEHFHSGTCHSCPTITEDYPTQLAKKLIDVQDILHPAFAEHPDVLWLPSAPSAPSQFRTHAKLVVGGSRRRPTLGILNAERRGVDLPDCPIQHPVINRAASALKRFIRQLNLTPYDVPTQHGDLKNILLTVGDNDQLMIRFVLRTRERVADIRRHLPLLRELIPSATVVTANIHPTHAALPEGPDEIILSPDTYLPISTCTTDTSPEFINQSAGGVATIRVAADSSRVNSQPDTAGHKMTPDAPVETSALTLQVGPRSFIQTNRAVAAQLYSQVATWATLPLDEGSPHPGDTAAPTSTKENRSLTVSSPTTLWDLYCGVGGFALHCARAGFPRVIGVEVSTEAIRSAIHAAQLCSLTRDQARFVADDAYTWAQAQRREDIPDVIVVNPPRRGIGASFARWLNDCGAPRIIYSSCNPATLVEDLLILTNYRPTQARLFDMFAYTTHAECAVLLSKK